MRTRIPTFFLILMMVSQVIILVQKKKESGKESGKEWEKEESEISSSTFSGLSFRSIGPAWSSGSISDFAVDPKNRSQIYAGVSAGNISQIVKDQLKILRAEFHPVLARAAKAGEYLQALEKQMDAIGASWTQVRVPKL